MDNYMTENKIPELMGNLMKNLAVSKPEDPIGFMIELLTKSDKRSDEVKEKLLKEIFDEMKRQQSVSADFTRKHALGFLKRDSFISKRFPHHSIKISALLVGNDSDDSEIAWNTFRSHALKVLSSPSCA